MLRPRAALLLLLIILSSACFAQDAPDKAGEVINFPSRFFDHIQRKTSSLDDQLTRQTEKYLERMSKREARLQKRLSKTDSAAASNLFAGSAQKYAALSQKLSSDTGSPHLHLSGEYQPYADSLQGMLKFLQVHPRVDLTAYSAQMQTSLKQLQTLQSKMQDAEQIKAYMRQRRQQISQYIQQHANMSSLLGKDYQAMNQESYYYTQQVRQYKDMLNDPDKIERQALAVLAKLPAFQSFLKQNSQLAGLFNVPGGMGAGAQPIAGLQTRDQIAGLIQGQLGSAGGGGLAAMQSNIQSARSQLNSAKEKLQKIGGGNSDMEAPDFKPNDQKTKSFWHRLEYGANFQTTRNNYYPTTTDFGGSIGYKINNKSSIGIGASYKLGWGTDIQHISFSSQGAGLRSFLDIGIKGSFAASGGFELNHATPIERIQQLRNWDRWTKSGLIGVTKTISLKNRVFKKTKVQLLWDFLSYQQVPRTQAVIFRIGYTF